MFLNDRQEPYKVEYTKNNLLYIVYIQMYKVEYTKNNPLYMYIYKCTK
jgi:hypothetical protein